MLSLMTIVTGLFEQTVVFSTITFNKVITNLSAYANNPVSNIYKTCNFVII